MLQRAARLQDGRHQQQQRGRHQGGQAIQVIRNSRQNYFTVALFPEIDVIPSQSYSGSRCMAQ